MGSVSGNLYFATNIQNLNSGLRKTGTVHENYYLDRAAVEEHRIKSGKHGAARRGAGGGTTFPMPVCRRTTCDY